MENVTDALYLSFAVLSLVIALALSMNTFSQARETSDIVIGTVEAASNLDYDEIDTTSLSYREVGLETIVPSLYRYYKENLTIVFLKGTPVTDAVTGKITGVSGVEPLKIYDSLTKNYTDDWDESYTGIISGYPSYGFKLNKENAGKICVFDIDEENARHEPFIADRKKNIDKLLSGNDNGTNPVEYNYRGETLTYDSYSNNPLFKFKSARYLELISREAKDTIKGNKTTRKTIITYIKIS